MTLDAEYSHLILLVRMELVQRRLPAQCLARLTRAADRHGLSLTLNKLAGFRDFLTRALEQAFDNPQARDHAAMIASLEEGLLHWLAWICVPSDGGPHAACRRRGLNRTLGYLRTTDISGVSVADLCRVARVSERTRRYAFRDELDLSPLDFLRRLRLHAARRELMNAEGTVPRVTDLANRQGFWSWGASPRNTAACSASAPPRPWLTAAGRPLPLASRLIDTGTRRQPSRGTSRRAWTMGTMNPHSFRSAAWSRAFPEAPQWQ